MFLSKSHYCWRLSKTKNVSFKTVPQIDCEHCTMLGNVKKHDNELTFGECGGN